MVLASFGHKNLHNPSYGFDIYLRQNHKGDVANWSSQKSWTLKPLHCTEVSFDKKYSLISFNIIDAKIFSLSCVSFEIVTLLFYIRIGNGLHFLFVYLEIYILTSKKVVFSSPEVGEILCDQHQIKYPVDEKLANLTSVQWSSIGV